MPTQLIFHNSEPVPLPTTCGFVLDLSQRAAPLADMLRRTQWRPRCGRPAMSMADGKSHGKVGQGLWLGKNLGKREPRNLPFLPIFMATAGIGRESQNSTGTSGASHPGPSVEVSVFARLVTANNATTARLWSVQQNRRRETPYLLLLSSKARGKKREFIPGHVCMYVCKYISKYVSIHVSM